MVEYLSQVKCRTFYSITVVRFDASTHTTIVVRFDASTCTTIVVRFDASTCTTIVVRFDTPFNKNVMKCEMGVRREGVQNCQKRCEIIFERPLTAVLVN